MRVINSEIRVNIRRVADLATAREIEKAQAFYGSWRELSEQMCSEFSLVSPEHGAGILAALSPMNNAIDNIDDAFSVCRYGASARVRTTHPNKAKAVRIRFGEHPSSVLVGRKVRAFYGAIAAPNVSLVIPVDRHLAQVAVNAPLSDHEISRLLSRHYGKIEQAYFDVGAERGLTGIEMSSVCWWTWRRLKLEQNHALPFYCHDIVKRKPRPTSVPSISITPIPVNLRLFEEASVNV